MDAIWILTAALVGVIVGGLGVWLLLRGKDSGVFAESAELRGRIEGMVRDLATAESEATIRGDRIVELEEELSRVEDEYRELQSRFHLLDVKFGSLVSEADEREKSYLARIEELKKMEVSLKETFENLSNKALRDSSDELLKQSKAVLDRYRETDEELTKSKNQEIEKMLLPVQGELKKLEELSRTLENERVKETTSLRDQLVALTSGTGKLISALQGNGSAGKWGEVQLRRIVELAGLQEGRDFVEQTALEGSEGALRPDMQVFLPGGRTMIIDSKVPIQDLDALEAADEDARKGMSLAISSRVMDYAKGLNKRDYAKLESAPDFVVMFIASESAFRMAVEGKSGLIEDAMNLNVVVATPSTLLPLLKAVNYGWRQERLAKEARNIQQWGKDLYDALVVMKGHYDDLGRKIDSVGKSYNKFGGSLDRTVIPKARKMAEAGLPVKEEIVETAVVEFSERELRAGDFLPAIESDQLSLE
ncbi:MAG: DNA recombination protein RmuC [Fimbriimonadaceae bacterium]